MDLEKIRLPNSLERESADFICDLIKKYKIKSVLEIGTSVGYSALRFSQLAKVTTIEENKEKIKLAKENFRKFSKEIILLEGGALELIPQLKEDYNLVFIDARKENYLKSFNLVLKLNPKIIIADNTESHKERMKDFLEEIKKYDTKFLKIGKGLTITYLI